MKIRDLNNEIHTWSLSGYVVAANEMRPRSKLHLAARELLIQLFPTVQVMEEVLVPLTRYEKGYFDFYINTLKLVVEVHGQQHYKFCKFFHKTKAGFLTSLKRDFIKEDWCNLNQIELVVLKYSDSVEDWRKQIDSR